LKTIAEKKKEAKKLQRELFAKLAKVQKLCIKRILNGGECVLYISSHAEGASLSYVGDLDAMDDRYHVRFKHWEHKTFEHGDSVCDFYRRQHVNIDYWIELLSK